MKSANQLGAVFAAAVWRIDPSAGSLRNQVYRQLRDAVTEGRVAPGAVVPSTRELSAVLGVSRSTLVEALDQLRVEGYLETRQGAPTRVASLRASRALARIAPVASAAAIRRDERWQQDDPPTPVTLRAFRPGLPDIRAFPAREWATHLGRRARRPISHDLSYVGHCGVAHLREQIVSHVAETRHVVARSGQVIVLPSAQAAFDVAIRCSLRPGDLAWMEDPGYAGMRTLLRAHGARIVPVPVDTEGMCPSTERSSPRLIYLTPSHQYPTGVTLSLERRLELLDRARRARALIIEDDYDSEFQIRGQPIASLQGLDRHGCVLYVGTFSKSLAPGLRVAYLIVPPALAELAETIANACGMGVPVHVQLAMADFMSDGGLRRHVHRMRAEYSARLSLLYRTLCEQGADLLQPVRPTGGLQLCAALPQGQSDLAVSHLLRTHGLHANALSELCHGEAWAGRQGLLMGVGLVSLEEVAPAAHSLCAVLRGSRKTATAG